MAEPGQWIDLEALSDASELQERLAGAFRGEPVTGMMAVTNRHGVFFARWSTDAASDEGQPIRIGCLAKVFTATLAATAAEEGLLPFDRDVRELRDHAGQRVFSALAGLTVTHLLSHTHGLDGSGISSVPRLGDRRIAVEALESACLSSRRLGRPGEVYSYGNIGPWLVGGLLERIYGCSYGELASQFVRSLGAGHVISGESRPRDAVEMCPATAGPAGISLATLMDLLRLHLGCDPATATSGRFSEMRSTHFPVPGWSTERAVTPGWKFYGDGWYGHSAQLSDWAATIRFHPEKLVGWAFASAHTSQFLLQTRIFGSAMPDVRHLTVPRPLRPEKVDPADLEACEGTYESAAHTFTVARGEGRTLKARILSRLEHGEVAERDVRLQPAGPRIYLVNPSVPEVLPIGQFLGEATTPEYLWNGRQMFRRVSEGVS